MQIGSGKVAVVTGGASGIGFAMATRFLERGMAVAVADVQEDALAEAVERLGAGGGTVLGVPTDVADHDQVLALRDRVLADLGGAHVLCNNAGVAAGGLMWETTPHDWEWILGVNLLGVVYGIQAFVPHLIEQGEGHVVNTASMAGVTSPPAMGPYNATKHAVVTISETLYGELQLMTGGAVGVSVLCPGWVRTNISSSDRNRPADLTDGDGALEGLDSPQRQMLEGLIAGGMDPLEVADIVVAGITEDRFYLFTNDMWNVMVEDRAQRVMSGENPRVGLPPGVELPED